MASPNLLAGSVWTPKVLASAKIAVTTDSAVFTVGAGHGAKIATMTLCNTDTVAHTCGVSVVASGGTVGDGTHKILADTFSIAAGDTFSLKDFIGGAELGDGDIIACHAGTANVIDVVITGTDIT